VKAICCAGPGGPEILELVETEVPAPGAGDVLIRHEAIGINFIDVYYRNGTYPAPHRRFTPGMEAAGVVTAVGAEVHDVAPGARVAYAQTLGSYAEYAVVPAAKVVAIPEGLLSREAAALMLQGVTAQYLARATFPLAPGHVALVHAGAGGVGLLLTQIAKRAGATVITTVSSGAKGRISTEAGADLVIDYTREDFVERARDYAPMRRARTATSKRARRPASSCSSHSTRRSARRQAKPSPRGRDFERFSS